MKKKKIIMGIGLGIILVAAATWGLNSMKDTSSTLSESSEMSAVQKPAGPAFNADSAYAFTKTQCEFGPRTMNSAAHDRCADWIISKFRQYGCNVVSQKADLKGYDGTILKAHNIIASYKPEAAKRILLCAHWDSRPWADNDPDSTNWHKPVMAANDGASGVAVMLEIARVLSKDTTLSYGIDFVCFDAEDWGTPRWANVSDDADSWALGAQYWSKNLSNGPRPQFGILFDMVGGQGAKFYQESASNRYASDIVKKVWKASRAIGYGGYFPNQEGGYITDDHIPVNENAKIPTIDIIPYYPDCSQSTFGPTWHTVSDTMDYIDKNTLHAVGQTVIQVLFTQP
ncbi:MAG: M28 family peptidase [Prevotella sp.]